MPTGIYNRKTAKFNSGWFKKGQKAWNKDKKFPQFSGKNHPNWKGENAKWSAIHMWVRRHKGKPQICQDCGATAKEKRLYWSNKDHQYRRNLDDYTSRCPTCHKNFDIKNNNTSTPNRNEKGEFISN